MTHFFFSCLYFLQSLCKNTVFKTVQLTGKAMKQWPVCGLRELTLMIWELAICEISLKIQWEKTFQTCMKPSHTDKGGQQLYCILFQEGGSPSSCEEVIWLVWLNWHKQNYSLCQELWAYQQDELHCLKLFCCVSDLKSSIVRSGCWDSRCAEVIMVTTCRKYLAFQSQGLRRSVLASSCWSAMSRKVQPNTSELHRTCESVCIRAHQI